MTTQNNINKDMVALLSSVTDGIHQLQKAVKLIHTEINDIKSSQNVRNDNFNDRLINLEENKIKVIDEELKRIDMLETAFNREL
jgi:esterase/lipase